MKLKNIFLTGSLVLLTAITVGQTTAFTTYDINRDQNIDTNEFSNMYTASYNAYDMDEDGTITDREFYNNSFERLNTDRDGNLNRTEWQVGYDNMYGPYMDSNQFSDYDIDRNNTLSRDEYYSSFSDSTYYSSYDSNNDNTIDINEYRDRTYKDWDRNSDGFLDAHEFNTYRPYYWK